jgi:beta-glucosidase
MGTTPRGWALLLVLALGCGKRDGFLWGAATAAYQVEGGLHDSDWYAWEQLGNIQNGDSADSGPDELHRYAEDLATAAKLGHNAYRFSLDWSRIEPTQGQYSAEGLDYYHRVLATCRQNHLTPMVTLSHFVLPTWLHAVEVRDEARLGWAGGGAAPGDGPIVEAFARFAGDMAEEFGKEVDLWVPLNEPMVLITTTYLNPNADPRGRNPRPPLAPGEPLVDLARAIHAMTNLIFAHVRAADAIRERDRVDADGDGKAALVGIAQHMRHFVPSPSDPGSAAVVDQAERAFNYLFLDAIIRGDLDITLDGAFDAAGERHGDAALKDRLDFIGINYYSRSEVYPAQLDAPSPYGPEQISLRYVAAETTDLGGPTNDLGWDLWPEGLYQVLTRTWQRYGLPLYVTENGIADASDSQRSRYVVEHVEALERARTDGADIRGYLHWTLMDNFEWIRGYGPKFGLLQVDYRDPARPRRTTRGAEALRAIIEAGKVTPEIKSRYAP